VVWSTPEQRDYKDFVSRLEQYQKRLDQWDVNYANHIYEVKGALNNNEGKLTYELTTTSDSYPIYYSLDGGIPSEIYKNPISVDSSMTIKAQVFELAIIEKGSLFEQQINLHKGVGSKITIDKEPHPSYNAGGKEALINGISGNNKRYGDKEWLGFSGEDIEITIEFDEPTEVKNISTRFHNGNGQWIYAPKSIVAHCFRTNNSSVLTTLSIHASDEILINTSLDLSQEENASYSKIKLIIPNYGVIPEGKQGAGHKAWTFIDEIIIE
jgi:hexosaminidase